MGTIATNSVRSVGTSAILALAANQSRRILVLQNKHASQTVRVKFGATHKADVVAVQVITFTGEPDAGSFKLTYKGAESAAIDFDDNAAAVQVAVRAVHTDLAAVTVAGDFEVGFTITMTSALDQGSPVIPELSPSSTTLTLDDEDIVATVATTVAGSFIDGIVLIAGAILPFLTPESCPTEAVYLLASGAATKVDILEG